MAFSSSQSRAKLSADFEKHFYKIFCEIYFEKNLKNCFPKFGVLTKDPKYSLSLSMVN